MGAKALTHAAIEKMKPPAMRREIPDGLVAGLYLVHQPSGARSWCVRYRLQNRTRKFTLGPWPAGSLAKARELARDAVIAAKQGHDPSEERKAARRKAEAATKNTLRSIVEEYLTRESQRLRTIRQRRAIFERLISPTLGERQIDTIKRTDIVRLLDEIEDECGSRMADYALATLRRVMNWHASRSDDFRSPIVRGMARVKTKERERERTLTDGELRAVWKTAQAAQGPFGALLRFLLLTAARRGEAAGLRWSEIDGTDWALPAVRNKTKVDLIRPLSTAAQAVLASIPRVGDVDLVFTTDGERPIGGFSKFKSAFDKACGISGWTLHDLRRTARSLMSRAGVPSDHAERALGHVMPGVRAVYDRHGYHAEMQRAFEALAMQIQQILDSQDDVTQLTARHA
jgi:integrase